MNNLIEFYSSKESLLHNPISKSNTFFNIGDGTINVYCIRNEPNNLFDVSIIDSVVYSGDGDFRITGDIDNGFNNFTVNKNTSLIVDKSFTIDSGELHVYGNLQLKNRSQILVINDGKVIFHPGSKLVGDDAKIGVEAGSKFDIYGEVCGSPTLIIYVLKHKDIFVDSSVVLTPNKFNMGDRYFSYTDYISEIRLKKMNVNNQGEYNNQLCRLSYRWISGDYNSNYRILDTSLLYGEIPSGDFKLQILGILEKTIPNSTIISSLTINKDTTLYISEYYKDSRYIYPELYIGIIENNNKIPGNCKVYGTIIVDGETCSINIDRKATLTIEDGGVIYLRNNGKIKSTYNDDNEVLFINGLLVIDNIEQIESFNSKNIVFGENGKIIILNNYYTDYKVLFSVPNGIHDSILYRLFEDRLDRIEYHIEDGYGIRIDKYYEFYSKDMTVWYDGKRIERAVKDGLIIWNNGFVELDNDIIPWVNRECTLYDGVKVFKSYNSFDEYRIQEVADRLRYCGFNNVKFRFVYGRLHHELTLVLEGVHISNILNRKLSNVYSIMSDNSGELFMKNHVLRESDIINKHLIEIDLHKGQNIFEIN